MPGYRLCAAVAAALFAFTVAASDRAGANSAAPPQAKPAEKPDQIRGFDLNNLDRTASACTDFNAFANGGWMSKNPIPPAYSTWGSFTQLSERNTEQLHQILEGLVKRTDTAGRDRQLADYYGSCMDEPSVESAGSSPIDAELKRIDSIGDPLALQDEIARFHTLRVPAVFGFGTAQDFKDSRNIIAQVVQGGLGLPDRDYYTSDDAKMKQTRDEYARHVTRMFQLLGDDPDRAAKEAASVMRIETGLAENASTRVQRRQPEANYHPMTKAQLVELTPDFDWGRYFRSVNLPEVGKANVAQPSFLKAAVKLLKETPLDDLKSYLRWHLVNSAADTLSSKFVNEDFAFNGKFLTGAQELQPRWRRCVASTDRALGESLGQLYVERTFTPQARVRAQEMVKNLVAALRDDLTTLSWMGDETRKRAIAKLDAFVRKIGYPDKWRSYEAVQISRGAYYNNTVSARGFEFRRTLGKIGKPVDRTEWGMTPPTVNAYYNPSINEIVFPAGILQPPFYDPNADDAFNYGGIGAVIGHEMTHGFDDQGAKFDADGNLTMWWTPDDFKKFKARTDCVVNQFSGYEVEPGLFQKGDLVVGESVADLGGLTVAYAAYQKSLEGKKRPPVLAGFTPEQRFFLGWAQVWAQNMRPEAARLRVATDPHPLGRFRVNGPLSNMPAFATAFQCKLGDRMVRPPESRCQIW
jgi:predicted metalloendopeptidase